MSISPYHSEQVRIYAILLEHDKRNTKTEIIALKFTLKIVKINHWTIQEKRCSNHLSQIHLIEQVMSTGDVNRWFQLSLSSRLLTIKKYIPYTHILVQSKQIKKKTHFKGGSNKLKIPNKYFCINLLLHNKNPIGLFFKKCCPNQLSTSLHHSEQEK